MILFLNVLHWFYFLSVCRGNLRDSSTSLHYKKGEKRPKIKSFGHIIQLSVWPKRIFAFVSKWMKAIFWYILHSKKIYHAGGRVLQANMRAYDRNVSNYMSSPPLSNIYDFAEKQSNCFFGSDASWAPFTLCFSCSGWSSRASVLVLKQLG